MKSIVNTSASFEEGVKKINWVRSHMPVLQKIEQKFIEEKPFQGLSIALSIHMEAKTANLAYVLSQGGADVYATGSNVLSTQDDVAYALSTMGVTVCAIHGVDDETYKNHLKAVLSCHPHIVIDDGGDLIDLLAEECKEYSDRLIGGCEETTTGILRLKARERDGSLPCAMFAVNDAKCKHYYDNKYGTGQSVMTAIMDTTNLVVAGKTVVVAGYGWCGKGVAMRAAGMGADVIITEIDPFKALDATMNGFRVMTMEEASKIGDIFITVTGCKDVITIDHMRNMKDGAILCNAGHFDCEVSVKDLKEHSIVTPREVRNNIVEYLISTYSGASSIYLLAEGRLVNLASGDGHPSEIMDMSFAVQAMSAYELAKHRDFFKQSDDSCKVFNVPVDIDNYIGKVKLSTLGLEIDKLTDEQERYLKSYSV